MARQLEKLLAKIRAHQDPWRALMDLPMSALNSLLLELFKARANQVEPAHLLHAFRENRFVQPSADDPIQIKEMELEFLQAAKNHGFKPLNLSPVTPLGSSSVLAPVDQNNVVSALRLSEVVSDATNVLALQIASEFKGTEGKGARAYAAVHRHIRGQSFANPKFSAHFSVMALASGGLDSGNFRFEIETLRQHILLLRHILSKYVDPRELSIRFYWKKNSKFFQENFKEANGKGWHDLPIDEVEDFESDYYQLVQFKLLLKRNKETYDVADGGVVDWTQKLLSNKKHRLVISGIGLELLARI